MGDKSKRIYDKYGEIVEPYKVLTQMFIGVLLVFSVFIKVVFGTFCFDFVDPFFEDNNVLKIIGYWLAVSAAVELAYMLFTPEPDEAVDPVILGVAALLLIVASADDPGLETALAVLALSVSIAVLFYVKQQFFGKGGDTQKKAPGGNLPGPV